MQKLISELNRLYLPPAALPSEALARHVQGQETFAIGLVTADDLTRGVMIPFHQLDKGDEAAHWTQLCVVANALQNELDLPAPAVSISGASGYGLWLSLETPTPVAQVQAFVERLHAAYFPEQKLGPDIVRAQVELPPCLNRSSGKWAAFIHPGMGASFAEESGLEMAPPLAGQVAFLEGLQSMSGEQFRHALELLQPARDAAPAPASAPSKPAGVPDGLLLKDATLEDIVRHLHSKNIEPTFRHLIPR
ncbi:hypothetical protein [Massilia niastensis]|uniref:hypothetical protein n=1 Tax=Massilia niastensis TaxID=544911 RepID=UPI0003638E43|nr:hypothetical protein [Massilia niastensis]